MSKFQEYLKLINESSDWEKKLTTVMEDIFDDRRTPDVYIEEDHIFIDYDLMDDSAHGWTWDMIYYDDIKKDYKKYSTLKDSKVVEIKSYDGPRNSDESSEKTFSIKVKDLKQIYKILENK